MKRQFSVWLVGFLMLCAVGAAAQQPPPPPAAPPAPMRGATPPRPTAPPTPARVADPSTPQPVQVMPGAYVDPSAGGQAVNIRLDVSISDQAGPGAVQPKMLTLLLADRSLSQLRSNFQDRTISMDARPTIVDGKIRLSLTISSALSNGLAALSDEARGIRSTINWNQSLTTIVESGKPLVAVENSDPATNRKLSVEVKATILK